MNFHLRMIKIVLHLMHIWMHSNTKSVQKETLTVTFLKETLKLK